MSVVTQSRLPKLENVCLECAEIFIEWFIHIASLLAQVLTLTCPPGLTITRNGSFIKNGKTAYDSGQESTAEPWQLHVKLPSLHPLQSGRDW